MKKFFFIVSFLLLNFSIFAQSTELETPDQNNFKSPDDPNYTEADYNEMTNFYSKSPVFMEMIDARIKNGEKQMVEYKKMLDMSYSESVKKFGKVQTYQFIKAFKNSKKERKEVLENAK